MGATITAYDAERKLYSVRYLDGGKKDVRAEKIRNDWNDLRTSLRRMVVRKSAAFLQNFALESARGLVSDGPEDREVAYEQDLHTCKSMQIL